LWVSPPGPAFFSGWAGGGVFRSVQIERCHKPPSIRHLQMFDY